MANSKACVERTLFKQIKKKHVHSTCHHEVGYLPHGGKLEIKLVGKRLKQIQKSCIPPVNKATKRRQTRKHVWKGLCLNRLKNVHSTSQHEGGYLPHGGKIESSWGKGRGLELVHAAYNYGTCNDAGQRGTELTCLMFLGIDCWGNKGKPPPP